MVRTGNLRLSLVLRFKMITIINSKTLSSDHVLLVGTSDGRNVNCAVQKILIRRSSIMMKIVLSL